MNWAMWESGAYDFPADLPGFTRGAVVELNRKDWALRAGLFELPTQPNSDILTTKGLGGVVEFEGRYDIAGQPGKVRLGAFDNEGNTGNYAQANTASTAISSSRSSRTSACLRAPAGTTAGTKSCPLPISIAACRADSRSRAASGDARTTRSASAAQSTASRKRIATSSPPASSRVVCTRSSRTYRAGWNVSARAIVQASR